jgi:phosphatidylserine/phosphatidylglycerophosphate/cardiolipin synthase-like enzyme
MMSKQNPSQESTVIKLFDTLIKHVSDSSKASEQESSLLDSSISAAKDFFLRQAAGGLSLIRFTNTIDDFIAVKGQVVELNLLVDRAQAIASNSVNFYVDEQHVGKVDFDIQGKVRKQFTPKEAGCFSVKCSIISKSGHEVFDTRTDKGVVLHVLDRKPVICVDAYLINAKKGKINTELKNLVEQGFEIVYIDMEEDDRVDDLRKIIHEHLLPKGAIISLTARNRQFESFDVDFKQSLLGLLISRLRAMGAPVVALTTKHKINSDHTFPDIVLYEGTQQINENEISTLKQKTGSFLGKRTRLWKTTKDKLEWNINEMVPGKWFNKNECQVQLNNKQARQEIFGSIDQAKKQIDLQFYIFKDCRFTQELGVRLSKAVLRGVHIRLMVDALWSRENFLGSSNNFLKGMAKVKNIDVLAADPVKFADDWDVKTFRQRDHRKLIIIDSKRAFIGGRNGADEYYYDWSEVPISDWTLADHIPWLDAHVQIDGSLVKEVQNLFNKTWKRNGGKASTDSRKASATFSTKIKNKTSRTKLVVHEGTFDANGLAAYEALISGAQKSLILVNDFPVVDDIADMLIQAVNRGVKVAFLSGSVLARRVDGSFFEGGKHRELFEYVVKSRLGELVDSGVKVYEFQTAALENIAVKGDRIRPYVHAKLVTADGRFASIGSANLDVTASYWEREANVFIDDTKVVSKLDRKFKRMFKSAIELNTSSKEWKREANQREIVARLWPDSFLN